MKSNIMKFITISLTLLLMSEFYICVNRRVKHRRRRQEPVKKDEQLKTKEYELSTDIKWLKFIDGFFNTFYEANITWMKCVPKKYKVLKGQWVPKPPPSDAKPVIQEASPEGKTPEQPAEIDENLSKDEVKEINRESGLTKVFTGLTTVTDQTQKFIDKFETYYCKNVEMAETLWEFIFKDEEEEENSATVPSKRSATKTSRHKIFIEGKFVRRRFRTRKQLLEWLKNKLSGAAQWVKDKLSKAWSVLSPEGQTFTTTVVNHVVNFKNYLVEFFSGDVWKKIIKIMNCARGLQKTGMKTFNLISKTYSLVKSLKKGDVVMPSMSQMILALFCNRKDFSSVVDDIGLAFKQTETPQRFYHWGRVIGRIAHLSNAALDTLPTTSPQSSQPSAQPTDQPGAQPNAQSGAQPNAQSGAKPQPQF